MTKTQSNTEPDTSGYKSLNITPEAKSALDEYCAKMGAMLKPARRITLSEGILYSTRDGLKFQASKARGR